ncbi:MAG: response regulator [Desulfamplus sp.]|nr:response regulator [Desulfamplus sp.]
MNKDHIVLIVDDEAEVGNIITKLLSKISVKSMYVSDAKEGLKEIRDNLTQFSLIIADQGMPEISGTEFFEKASSIAPDAIRFLITGNTNIHTMIDAVNKGAIHKYIAKPWNNKDFLAFIKEGLEQHELALENTRLFTLAKQQNIKLFELNRTLNESAKKREKMLNELDDRIVAESNLIIRQKKENEAERERIKKLMLEEGLIDLKNMNRFYGDLLNELAHDLRKTALKHSS